MNLDNNGLNQEASSAGNHPSSGLPASASVQEGGLSRAPYLETHSIQTLPQNPTGEEKENGFEQVSPPLGVAAEQGAMQEKAEGLATADLDTSSCNSLVDQTTSAIDEPYGQAQAAELIPWMQVALDSNPDQPEE